MHGMSLINPRWYMVLLSLMTVSASVHAEPAPIDNTVPPCDELETTELPPCDIDADSVIVPPPLPGSDESIVEPPPVIEDGVQEEPVDPVLPPAPVIPAPDPEPPGPILPPMPEPQA